ncbi:MAG: hypothetical protein EOO27_07035 [Comamonadaceae bacterium]|nr:MAG: hypothetical protein EOO27_07035 [Comamonadaceae bacterium]
MAELIFKPAGALMSTAERAWWTAAEHAEGPYSPRAGLQSELFCGGSVALQRDHQVDVSGLVPGDLSKTFATTDQAGRTWYCRWIGTPFWTAFRDRTDDETADYIERSMDSVNRHIRSSAMSGLWSVSDGLFQTFDAMRPERQMPRAERRRLKRRLTDLSNALGQLLCVRMTGREVRQLCQEAGIRVHGPDHQRWLDENYQ